MDERIDGGEAPTPPESAWPIHPFIWACYPIVWLFAQNARKAWPTEIILPIVAAVIATGLMWLALRPVIPSPSRRAVLLSPTMIVLVGYDRIEPHFGPLFFASPLATWFDATKGHVVLTVVVTLALVISLVILARVLRSGPPLPKLTQFLNVAAIVTLLMSIVPTLWIERTEEESETVVAESATDPSAHEYPDIFLIMLDAYAGLDRLEEFYGLDNRPFLDELEARGFYVARESHGNYEWTHLCISSLLNMHYILEPESGPRNQTVTWNRSKNIDSYRNAILNSRVVTGLRSRGYKVVAFETPQSELQLRSADVYLKPGRSISEFQRVCMDMTLPVALLSDAGVSVKSYLNDEQDRRRIRYVFQELETLGGDDRPSFIWAHVMAPHGPFIFRSDGSRNPTGWVYETEPYRNSYREQLLHTNKLVLDAVSSIQSRLPEAIIVVQGDHGARLPELRSGEPSLRAREYLSSLWAVYVPAGEGYETLSPGFSQVNTFRYLFDTLFGEDLPYQPDISYMADHKRDNIYVPVKWNGYEPEFLDSSETPPLEPWRP